MALTRQEINKRSREKLGMKTKAFTLDAETIALFETLAAQTGLPQAEILRRSVRLFAEQVNA